MSNTEVKKGDVLISKPSILGDVTFNKAMILITDFNPEGVVGFIINKPLNEDLQNLLPEINKDFKVFDGGPVERDKLYFIHDVPELIPGGLKVSSGLYWGGDQKQVMMLINESRLDHTHIKFFLGYSGWSTTQLEDEINDDVWLIQNSIVSSEIISCENTNFWNKNIKSLGGEYLIWSNAPDNPNYN